MTKQVAPSKRPICDFTEVGLPFKVRDGTNDRDVIRSIFQGEYAVPGEALPFQPTFVDIGGHLGAWSCWMSRRFPSSKGAIVEPIPENLDLIRENFRLQNMNSRFHVLPGAVGGPQGDEFLEIKYDNPETESGAIHEFVGNAFSQNPRSCKVSVRNYSLADILDWLSSAFSVPRSLINIDMMKIDCEGGEYGFFKTASLLDLKKIKYLVGEYHGDFVEFYSYFKAAGFISHDCSKNPNSGIFLFERK